MEALKLLILVSMGVIAGWIGFQAYPSGDLWGGLFVVFTAAWILFRFTGYQLAWDTASWFIQPNMLFILGFMASISFYMVGGNDFSWTLGLGAGFLASALAMTLYNYWTIGD